MLKMLAALLGVSTLIVSVSVLFAGGGLLWADAVLTDVDGFVNTVPMTVEVDGFALVAGPADIELPSLGALDTGEIATVRIQVESTEQDPGIFLGVGDAADVETYLAGVPYAVLESVESDALDLTYRTEVSGALPGPPADETFWTASVSGSNQQVLTWELETGSHSFVVMQEDASEGMSFDAVVGVRVPALQPIGFGILVGGIVMFVTGAVVLAVSL